MQHMKSLIFSTLMKASRLAAAGHAQDKVS